MAIDLICPSCATALTFNRPPVAECGSCHAPLPSRMRLTAEASLARAAAPRPILLTVGMVVSALAGIAVMVIVGLIALGVLTPMVYGEKATLGDSLSHGAILYVTAGPLLGAVAYGLWKGRTWTRPIMVFFWVLFGAYSIASDAVRESPTEGIDLTVVFNLCCVAASALYLYRAPSALAYYRALALTEAADADEPITQP